MTVPGLALALIAGVLRAQGGPLQVLRHSPSDTASPGNIVTVTFDRPVAGRLDATIEAARIFRIDPAPAGQLLWRDPITIRFVPDEPFAPGSVYTVTIDTTFRAIDGSRLAAPYQFTFRVPGPRLLSRSFNYDGSRDLKLLPVDGKVKLLYSAPIDLERLRAGVRLELPNCGPTEARLVPVAQRKLLPDDPYGFTYAGGWDRDTTADRFRRVVELAPTAELPPECTGRLVIPNTDADSLHGPEESYPVRTAARFRLTQFACAGDLSCSLDNLVIEFTAPVKRDDVLRFVRLDPPAPLAYAENVPVSASWPVKIRLTPRTTYAVVVSDSLRDIHGRALEGARTARFETGDYMAAIGYPRGVITVPRAGRLTLPVRHVNVRAVRLISHAIPDAERYRLLGLIPWQVKDAIGKLGLRAETTTVALDAAFNAEAVTQVPLPPSIARRGTALVALRMEVAGDMTRPDEQASPFRIRATRVGWYANEFAFVQVTDLAVHAKLAPGAGTVLVTSLTDGRPRAGARVRQLGADGGVLAQGVTGADGIARLQPPRNVAVVPAAATRPIANDWPPSVGMVEAELDSNRVVAPLALRRLGYEPVVALPVAQLGARMGGVPRAAAAVLADRGIYRPGDMLYLKGVVRYGALGALAVPPAGDSVRLTVTYRSVPWYPSDDDEGEYPPEDDDELVVRDTVLRVSDLGTVADSVRLRAGLPLGTYVAELKVVAGDGGRWSSVATQHVRVAEYRAPEFLIDAAADSGVLHGNDTLRVQVNGRYLFGAPMGRAALSWSAVLHEARPWEVRIPGADGWTVGAWDWWSERDRNQPPKQLWGEDSLDVAGRANVRVPLEGLDATRPGRVVVEIAVTDVNRQSVSASASAQVHAGDLYILARRAAAGWLWKTGERTTVEIRAVRPDGSTVSGVPVAVAVVRKIWRGNRDGGSPWSDEPLVSDTVTTDARPVAFTFTVPSDKSGAYEVRLSAPNGRGGVARTTLAGYAVGGGGYAWWAGSPLHLPLVVEQRDLAVGDEAGIVFDSPFDSADAWVTIEREHVLEQRHMVVLRGSNAVRVPLAERHIPNVFVSVMLRRRAAPAWRPDSAAQLLRVGYAELRVKTSPKRLTVALEPERAEYQPRDAAVIRLRVRDAAGRGVRGEVTLWAVDQGVLALTDFATPDLLARMYAPRGLGVGFWSSLPYTLTADPGLFLQLGREMAMRLSSAMVTGVSAAQGAISVSTREPAMRTQFRPTAFYLASTRTDASGNGVARASLPDNLTTFRVMAVAVGTDNRFGSGDTTLLVTRALVARPTLPRFVRAGDTLLAGAAINARDGRERPVTVDAAGDGIRLMGEPRQEIALAPGKGAEARFQLAVPPRDRVRDSVVMRVRASDGTDGDAVETRLPVRPDFHPRTHARFGMLRDAAEVEIALPEGTDPKRSTLSLILGNSPLAPMLAAYDRLRVYPYHCTEQIASGGRALVAVWRATRERDPAALGGDPRARLQELVQQIERRQRPDGAIKYWDDYDWSTPWLSAYAGLFLLDAREAGIPVEASVLQRLSKYVAKFAASAPDTGGMNRFDRRARRLALGDRVASVEYLRRAGAPDVKAEEALLALAPTMTWEDRLRLAEVVSGRAEAAERARALVDAAWRAVTPAGRRVDLPDSAHAERAFPSRIAPAARLLTASLAARPEHEWIGGLVETVLQHGRAEGRWAWSTQDYASVVIALAALPQAGAETRQVQVHAGGRVVASRRVSGAKKEPPVPIDGMVERGAGGTMTLRVRLTGTGGSQPLYFALAVDEVPSQAPVRPDIQGIVVERWYERLDDGQPVTSVQEGDFVRVRLRVTVPADRQFVAVEDPLPAGLEPVDLSLRTSGTLKPFVNPEADAGRTRGDRDRDGPRWQSWLYGRWDGGWWSPWEHKALYDDRVVYFARALWPGSYSASYVARATTAGTFVRPPAHAEEMYNPGLQGRSDGGRFVVEERVRRNR